MNTDHILSLIEQHPQHEPLLLLSALSAAWLEPQSPDAAMLIEVYRRRRHPLEALREASLQLFLLAGFQTSLEAAFQIEDIYGAEINERTSEDVLLDLRQLRERGQELQARVYQGNTEKLRANLERVSPELAEWTVWIGYGLVLSRPGLPSSWRELLEVAVLAVQGFPRQLHSHLRGALNLGASAEEIDLVLEAIRTATSEERHRSALQMWRRIRQTT